MLYKYKSRDRPEVIWCVLNLNNEAYVFRVYLTDVCHHIICKEFVISKLVSHPQNLMSCGALVFN